jgi:antitoxin ParD1/3/4
MRTNIVIDDQLMSAAMRAGEFKTKKDAVEEGLRLLARRKAYQDIRGARGTLQWSIEGDWTEAAGGAHTVQEPRGNYRATAAKSVASATKSRVKRVR